MKENTFFEKNCFYKYKGPALERIGYKEVVLCKDTNEEVTTFENAKGILVRESTSLVKCWMVKSGIQEKNWRKNNVSNKVDNPSHYTWLGDKCGIDPIEICRHFGFSLGNTLKYIFRAGHKTEEGYTSTDKEIEDLKKAEWYLHDHIKYLENCKKSDK